MSIERYVELRKKVIAARGLRCGQMTLEEIELFEKLVEERKTLTVDQLMRLGSQPVNGK